MPLYAVEVWEEARVKYEVSADNEGDARAKYERGDVPPMSLDEHESGEIVSVTRI